MTGAAGFKSKRQLAQFEKLLASYAKQDGVEVEELKQTAEIGALYTQEAAAYEAQACLNFYEARVEPFLGKQEKPEDFDKRFREWRFRLCKFCEEQFAYAYNYEGVSYCSLDCLEQALLRIGIKFSRGKDLKKRWGVFYHPAIVSATALEALKTLYNGGAPEAFDDSLSDHPKPQVHSDQQDDILL